MRRIALVLLLTVTGCATANVERSTRNEVAVATEARDERVSWSSNIRIRPQQVFVPSRADGGDEFCSTSPTFFGESIRPSPMCFRDTDGRGRFNRAYMLREKRDGGGVAVSVPYTIQPFPCSSCVVSSADLTRISDPQILAEQSIAPPELRPYVQLALSNSPDTNAAIDRSQLPDKQAARSAVALAAREVRDRRAVAICSSQNPGGAVGALGLLGAIATIAGSASERSCMDDYIRTGAMPVPPAPLSTNAVN
ncbi:hypothetical protein [Roseomonas xinghualingensis]|uniref:hypothetical protein n=1 Tax=Roseomonas xinghualingensis TaxID=2986475 RepID=UPI0021F159B0|nr:hypothetical protein [Roseomonas sp. SXEYE001]MCV4209993.1 hypothetical protein [Roseomonas sp. SXEYE001]